MNYKQFIRQKEWAWRVMTLADTGELNQAGKIALADLRNFCHGTKSVFSSDPCEMARIAGRQEVFQRIMTFLNYDYSKIYEIEEDIVDE